jgi:hypothetical protein
MNAIKKNLSEILDRMDVPKLRKELTPANLRWLKRNLGIRNSQHPAFPSAVHFINHLIWAGEENESR